MNAVVTTTGSNALTPTSMDSAIQLAEMMARGKLVPEHLQGSPGDCLMVIEQALRWGMSPFAVAQCTGIVKGKMSYEGKLVAAAVHTSGVLNGRLDYKFSGEGAARVVTASGHLKGETVPRTVEVALASARTTNEHWNKSPDQMLTYHAARVWARRHAPEVMLGVYAPEEFDAPPKQEEFNGTTIEAKAEAPPPPPPSRRDVINKEIPLSSATSPSNGNGKTRHSIAPPAGAPDAAWRECLDKVAPALARMRTRALVEEMAAGPTCSDIVANGPEWARAELAQLLADNVSRFAKPATAAADELPDVEIAGAEKVSAG